MRNLHTQIIAMVAGMAAGMRRWGEIRRRHGGTFDLADDRSAQVFLKRGKRRHGARHSGHKRSAYKARLHSQKRKESTKGGIYLSCCAGAGNLHLLGGDAGQLE